MSLGLELGAFENTKQTVNQAVRQQQQQQQSKYVDSSDMIHAPSENQAASVEFALKWLLAVGQHAPESTFVTSPCTTQITFGMCYLGAESLTKRELKDNIFPRAVITESYLKKLTKTVTPVRSLCSVSRLFATDRAQFRVSYNKKLGAILSKPNRHWSMSELDFENDDSDALAAYVNGMIDEKFQGFSTLTDSPFPAGVITPKTRLLVAQAFSYKTEWNWPFLRTRPDETCRGNFYRSHTCPGVMVDYMEQRNTYRFFEDDFVKILRKTTPTDGVGMYFLLPKQRCKMTPDEFRFLPKDFLMLLRRCSLTPVTLKLPKFRIEKPWHEISEMAVTLGVTESFRPLRANFCHLVSVGDLDRGFSISNIIQKFSFQLDEGDTGKEVEPPSTETEQSEGGTTSSFNEECTFIADHPFLFFLVMDEPPNMLILLAGRYSGPEL